MVDLRGAQRLGYTPAFAAQEARLKAGDSGMQSYDIVMLVVLLGTTVFGDWKGMAWQVASMASLVVSYAAALHFSEPLAHNFGQQAPLNRFIAMAVIYAGTSLAIWLLFRIVRNMIDRVRLQEFDRQMGAILGAAKGVLFCVAITFFAVTLSDQARSAALHSRSGHFIAVLLDRAEGVMPRELHDVLSPYLNTLEDGLDPTKQPRRLQPTIPQRVEQPEGDRAPERVFIPAPPPKWSR